ICNLSEIKYDLTIDQVYLFYEKCLKAELDDQKFDAIKLANALVYASPSYDRSSSDKKQRMWDRFINSLTWEKLTKPKQQPDPDALVSVFGGLGVPATKPKPKKGDT
ncbi:MAG: hypothetical protein KKD48_05120, partial [Nanoarchaeota archaeon]|nr:hypothetical protein [Nanoarchaeota archaeon]